MYGLGPCISYKCFDSFTKSSIFLSFSQNFSKLAMFQLKTKTNMNVDFLDFDKIPQLSARDKAYQNNHPALRPFYKYDFEYASFSQIIEDRKQFPVNRTLLVQELQKNYGSVEHSTAVAQNIEKLAEENCFTVITAHQPSLFTGPLYYVIKIASAINLAKKLNASFPDNHIVPVFIIGAEDHDFAEINHTYIFNKKINWEREASGSVGRLNNDGLDEAIDQLKDILGSSENSESLKSKIDFAYKHANNYGEFSFLLTHQLFDKYGLVIANFDNKAYKKEFASIIKREVNEEFSKAHILASQEKLIEAGFSDQAYARDINFFYLTDNTRSRIEFENDRFLILNTDLSFSLEEINREIDEYPERFSPNVIMRPLYQETIMPNLAYIGGGGELAYWVERKTQFEDAGVFYPMLIRRNSVLWISSRNKKQLKTLDLSVEDLTRNTDQLIKDYALGITEHNIDFTDAYNKINEAYAQINEIAVPIDGSLGQKLQAMKAGQINGLDKLQARLVKSIKQNQEVTLNKVKKIQEALFPGGSLQERKTNFMEIYLQQGDGMLDFLIETCNPFEKRFLIISED